MRPLHLFAVLSLLLACSLSSQLPQATPTTSLRTDSDQAAPLPILTTRIYTPPQIAASPQIPSPLPLLPTIDNRQPFIGPNTSASFKIDSADGHSFSLHGRPNTPWLALAIPDNNTDPIIDLYNEQNSLIASTDERGTADIESLFFTTDSRQTISLKIRPFTFEAGITQTITTALFNLAQQTPLIDKTDGVAIAETKRYQFTIPPKTPVLIQVTPEGVFDPVFELYTADRFLHNIDGGTNGEQERWVGLYSPNETTYNLTIFGFQGGSGTYRLTVLPLPCCQE